MEASEKKISVLSLLVLLLLFMVLIEGLFLIRFYRARVRETSSTEKKSPVSVLEKPTRVALSSVDALLSVPEPNTSGSVSVAVPASSIPTRPGSQHRIRSFDITISPDGMTPDRIAVHVGDTVRLLLTPSQGASYFVQPDFGFRVPLPAGIITPVAFDATISGDFYVFNDPVLSSVVGHLLVLP